MYQERHVTTQYVESNIGYFTTGESKRNEK